MVCTWAHAIQAVLANYFKVVLDFEKSFLIDRMPGMTKGQGKRVVLVVLTKTAS